MSNALYNNVTTRVDSYKYGHFLQRPEGATHYYDYIESRGGRWKNTVFFGLQMFLEKLTVPFSKTDVDDTEDDVRAHGLSFDRAGFDRIVNVHGGYLPLTISALPEGTVLPTNNALVTVINNDPQLASIPGFSETALLRGIWYPTTVATNSFYCKLLIMRALEKSSDDPAGNIAFRLHDFSGRGVSSGETAELGGAAHLVNFMGTDTFECLRVIRRVYGEQMAGFSINASEHSTTTSWGRDREIDFYRHMLKTFAKPGAMVACVSDSYDLWTAINSMWGDALKQEVIDSGATVIIRPDSGNPETVPARAVAALADKFGFTVNHKGYKVLPPYVRVIQGDGINETTIGVILDNLLAAGFSAENLAFGMGGALAQQIDRDTLKFAMKASAAKVNGEWIDVYKDPIDDAGKRSKRGRLAVIETGGAFQTVPLLGNEDRNLLEPVYVSGEIIRKQTFSDIRARAHAAALKMA